MLKKLLAILLCAAFAVTFVSCTSQKKQKEDDVQNEIQTEQKNEEKTGSDLKANIKLLEETDGKVLSEAAAKLGFENEKFFHAFSNAIGKKPEEVTQADVDKVHYIAVGPDDNESYSVFVGYVDYVDMCFSKEAENEDIMTKLNDLVMMSKFEYNIAEDSLSDLGKFKNVEMFEIYNVNIDDVSFIKNYNKLSFGYFNTNGITDVSCLEGYNPESLKELDFTGNQIEDWTPLYPIKDKVIVYYEMSNGFLLTLESYIEQKENPVALPSEETTDEPSEKAENNADGEEFAIVDENGNPVDFSSLFD